MNGLHRTTLSDLVASPAARRPDAIRSSASDTWDTETLVRRRHRWQRRATIHVVMVMGITRRRESTVGTTQKQYNVGGMACSFCAESIEKAYDRTDGVEDVDVSLAHEEVLVRYDEATLSEVELKDTLRDLGYTIRDLNKRKRFEERRVELADGKRRLLLAGGASITTAALMLWMILVTGRFESESLAMDLVTLAVALGTVFGPGRYIIEKAYNSLRRGHPQPARAARGGGVRRAVRGVPRFVRLP